MEERSSASRPLDEHDIRATNYEFPLSFTMMMMTMMMRKTYIAFSTHPQTSQGVKNPTKERTDGIYSVSAISASMSMIPIFLPVPHGSRQRRFLLFFKRALGDTV